MGLYDTKLDISEFLAGSHHLSQRAKRNGDFRCYQQAAYPVPPAAICRVGREGYSCCFQVIFLRFSQIQCNLLGTPHKEQEGINEQPGQPVWGPLKVVFSFRNYTGIGQLGWELVRRANTGRVLFLQSV